MFRINWGMKIVLMYCAFVGMILTLVIASTFQDFQLVSPNYYAEEIAYEGRISQQRNVAQLSATLNIEEEKNEERLAIHFPEEALPQSGKIWLYRPSNEKYDQHLDISLNHQNTQFISTQNLSNGLWRIKVEWSKGEEEFYVEKVWVKK